MVRLIRNGNRKAFQVLPGGDIGHQRKSDILIQKGKRSLDRDAQPGFQRFPVLKKTLRRLLSAFGQPVQQAACHCLGDCAERFFLSGIPGGKESAIPEQSFRKDSAVENRDGGGSGGKAAFPLSAVRSGVEEQGNRKRRVFLTDLDQFPPETFRVVLLVQQKDQHVRKYTVFRKGRGGLFPHTPPRFQPQPRSGLSFHIAAVQQ